MDASPFAKLPLELHEMIYKAVLTSERPLAVSRTQVRFSMVNRVPDLTNLLKTCRQMHAESAPLLYSTNTIEITQSRFDKSPAVSFLCWIGLRNSAALRKLVVSTSDLPMVESCYLKTERNIASARLQFFDMPVGALSEMCELVLKGTFLYVTVEGRLAPVRYELNLKDLRDAFWKVATIAHGIQHSVDYGQDRCELEGQIKRLAEAASRCHAGESVIDNTFS